MEEATFTNIDFYFATFTFLVLSFKKSRFHSRSNPSEKVVIVEEELGGIDI